MDIETVVAEKVQVSIRKAIDRNHLACLNRAVVESFVDYLINAMVVDIRTYIHGITKERIRVHHTCPVDWWQAFKERWFPSWALGRWPVKYDHVDVDEPKFRAVCPHIQDDPRQTHLKWMWQTSVAQDVEIRYEGMGFMREPRKDVSFDGGQTWIKGDVPPDEFAEYCKKPKSPPT